MNDHAAMNRDDHFPFWYKPNNPINQSSNNPIIFPYLGTLFWIVQLKTKGLLNDNNI